ncbi:MAG: 16S rRNA processing protein RimM [Candidatus Eremiobacteraeota bacterium]|nr:16S rRNA processing protein RimM [Candidatus Eremiobacteraeota bacterium]MBV8371789.1 16S rRNA processing protein RimM [Candidatus Eremiobacteraeota bacterium]
MTTRDPADLPVGRIAGAFGIRGEMKCDPTTAGRIVFSAGATLRCQVGMVSATLHIVGVRPHQGRLLIRAEGIDDAVAAKGYTGAVLYAPREQLEVAADEYLDADLIGCRVDGVDGTAYGAVEAVEHFPSSDMLVVARTLVPMVRAYVVSIDVSGKRIVIDPPAGLFEP